MDALGSNSNKMHILIIGCIAFLSTLGNADASGDEKLSVDEWMAFLMGFWRYHPQRARANVNFLLQRAEELRSMPAMPPRPP